MGDEDDSRLDIQFLQGWTETPRVYIVFNGNTNGNTNLKNCDDSIFPPHSLVPSSWFA